MRGSPGRYSRETRAGRVGFSLAGRQRLHLGDCRSDPGDHHRVSLRNRLDECSTCRLGTLLETWNVHTTFLNEDRGQDVGRIAERGKASHRCLVYFRRAERFCGPKPERIEKRLSQLSDKPDFAGCFLDDQDKAGCRLMNLIGGAADFLGVNEGFGRGNARDAGAFDAGPSRRSRVASVAAACARAFVR